MALRDPDNTRIQMLDLSGPAGNRGSGCLVAICGPGLGRRIPLDGPSLSIGREDGNDVTVPLEDVSRHHSQLVVDQRRVFVEDLGSTNGTYLNRRRLPAHEGFDLRPGDLVQVGGAIFKFLDGGNVEAQYHEEVYRMTIVDGLTEVSNRRFLFDFLTREMSRCRRHHRPLSMILFDVDHFKPVNDRLGHVAGDAMLRELADLVRPHIRREECFARYGGDEFAVVMPDLEKARACRFAEKIRGLTSVHSFSFEGQPVEISVSLGVAEMGPTMVEPSQFIRAAEAELYAAKNAGRGSVGSHPGDLPLPGVGKAARRGPRTIARRKLSTASKGS